MSKLADYYHAFELALRIWNIYQMPKNWEPFDSIDWSTAWEVGKIVHFGGTS
jgi:hypothetical protein